MGPRIRMPRIPFAKFFDTMREAGATARLMSVQAAAGQWSVPVSQYETGLHMVVHLPNGSQMGIWGTRAPRLKVACSPERSLALQASHGVALYWQGRKSLRFGGHLHGESRLWYGRTPRWHGLRFR